MDARRPLGPAVSVVVAALLVACSHSHEERESRVNVFPDNYRADILAALHTYVADPTNIRGAIVANPASEPIGPQSRYTVCVRFNAKNSDGRYTGRRDLLAIFTAGRFDQFAEQGGQPPPTPMGMQPQPGPARDLCAQADYKRFPELESLKR